MISIPHSGVVHQCWAYAVLCEQPTCIDVTMMTQNVNFARLEEQHCICKHVLSTRQVCCASELNICSFVWIASMQICCYAWSAILLSNTIFKSMCSYQAVVLCIIVEHLHPCKSGWVVEMWIFWRVGAICIPCRAALHLLEARFSVPYSSAVNCVHKLACLSSKSGPSRPDHTARHVQHMTCFGSSLQQGFEQAVQSLSIQAVRGAVAVKHEAHTANISI